MSRVSPSTHIAHDDIDFVPYTSPGGAFSVRAKDGEFDVPMVRCGWLERGPIPINGAVVTVMVRVARCAGECHAS